MAHNQPGTSIQNSRVSLRLLPARQERMSLVVTVAHQKWHRRSSSRRWLYRTDTDLLLRLKTGWLVDEWKMSPLKPTRPISTSCEVGNEKKELRDIQHKLQKSGCCEYAILSESRVSQRKLVCYRLAVLGWFVDKLEDCGHLKVFTE